MILIRKILPAITGLMISGLIFSCTGGPETTDNVQGNTGEEIKKDNSASKEDTYETKSVDIFKVSRESYFLDDGSENWI